jgi:hypothetical protein
LPLSHFPFGYVCFLFSILALDSVALHTFIYHILPVLTRLLLWSTLYIDQHLPSSAQLIPHNHLCFSLFAAAPSECHTQMGTQSSRAAQWAPSDASSELQARGVLKTGAVRLSNTPLQLEPGV